MTPKETSSKGEEGDVQKEAVSDRAFGFMRSRDGQQAGPSLWLITFTDIMALMLTFFVLLYSMSVPQEEKWEEIVDAVNSGFSKFESPREFAGDRDTIAIEKLDLSEALNLDYLQSIIENTIAKDERLQNVNVIPQSDRLIVSLPQDLLFEAGKAEIGEQGKRAVFTLGVLLSRIRNRIEVVGHTDPKPVPDDSAFASNWHLSLARAAGVSNLLLQTGYRRDVMVRGVSNARYDELPVKLDEALRNDLSRRVDIVVMRDDGSRLDLMAIGN